MKVSIVPVHYVVFDHLMAPDADGGICSHVQEEIGLQENTYELCYNNACYLIGKGKLQPALQKLKKAEGMVNTGDISFFTMVFKRDNARLNHVVKRFSIMWESFN